MKVKVVTEFNDKHTGVFNAVGKVIEVTDERYAELKAAGNYVVPAADTPATVKAPSKRAKK